MRALAVAVDKHAFGILEQTPEFPHGVLPARLRVVVVGPCLVATKADADSSKASSRHEAVRRPISSSAVRGI